MRIRSIVRMKHGKHLLAVVALIVLAVVLSGYVNQRDLDNPYTARLLVPTVLLSVVAAFVDRAMVRIALLALATLTYWAALQSYVEWSFNHPFNPDDGGPKAFAFLFGWMAGLLLLVLPTYGLVRYVVSF